jgi:serine protease
MGKKANPKISNEEHLMKTVVFWVILLCILPATLMAAEMQIVSMPDGSKYLADRFIVTIRTGVTPLEIGKASGGKAISGVTSIDYLCLTQNVTQIEPWYPGIIKTPSLAELVNRMYIIHVAPGSDVINAREAFRGSPDIEYSDVYDIPELFYTPNDPQRTSQWHLTKIQAYQAWDLFRGDTTRVAVIGIVDTGVYYTHPDLAPNMWVNSAEDLNGNGIKDAGDINGVDDDGNGYIDDVIGWDLARNDNNPAEDSPIHGTHVAGCASEATDNSLNGAGIGFHARIMAVKGGSHDTLTAVYQGLTYAADNGANVINCSWGSSQLVPQYQGIINNCWNSGVIVVAAAGNNGTNARVYPGAYNNVLSVASTMSSDVKSDFSSYGTWVDVSAPGSGIFSTWSTNQFVNMDGTSMASPITAGLVGLLRAAHPDWSNQDVVDAVISTTDNIDSQNPSYVGQLGSGRINAFRALGSASFPFIKVDTTLVTITNDDGDGILNPGESISMTVALSNLWANATNVNVKLRSTGFDFTDSTASYGNIGHNEQVLNGTDSLKATARMDIIPGDQRIIVFITADSTYSREDTIMINVSLYQQGFPKDIAGNIESSPVIFDFDKDGANELLFGADDNNVYAFRADGSNCTGWPQAVTGNALTGPAIGDIDHDGDNEVVQITRDGKFYAWHANGTIVNNFPINKGGTFYSGALLIDVNNDQNLEIVAGSFTDNKVYAIKSDGTDLAGWPTAAMRQWYGSPSGGDIDGDQIDDIVYAGFDSTLHVWKANGAEAAGFPVHLAGPVWCSPSIGDVNNDGHLEIAVVTYSPGKVYLVNYLGQVMTGFPVSYSTSLRSTPSLVDLNNDSYLEIVFGTSDGNLRVLKNDGTDLAGFPATLSGSVFGTPVVGDISGDGAPDIVVGATSGNLYGFDHTGAVLRNFPILGTSSRQISGSTALGDLDLDGRMEIVVPIKATGSNLVVYDYRTQASIDNLKWPNFGRDSYRRNNASTNIVSVKEAGSMPVAFALSQNYPNPFNGSTAIRFSLQADGKATLTIFDILGRKVNTLQSGMLPAGEHAFTWNGTDESGVAVTSGVYFYRLESADGTLVKRMVMLK